MATATLNWSANPAGENVDSYNVEQSVDGGATWQTVGNVASPTFTTSALTPGVPYKWRVRAHNAAGFSVPSASVDVPQPPTQPSTPTVTLNP